MLTKNFYSFIRAAFQKVSAEFTTTGGTAKQSGFISTPDPPFVVMNKWTTQTGATGVSFGTGTTPATVSDYWLESLLDSAQIKVATPSAVSFSRFDAYDEYSVTFGVTNKTSNDITISEVGLTAMPASAGSTMCYVLVDHTVLETPVTIPANQSKQITYTIRFNY